MYKLKELKLQPFVFWNTQFKVRITFIALPYKVIIIYVYFGLLIRVGIKPVFECIAQTGWVNPGNIRFFWVIVGNIGE